MNEDRETLLALPDRRRMAPLKAASVDDAFNDWPIAYQTGNSGEDSKDWAIVTDNVRASALMDMEFPADAKEDAEAIVAILMAYRSGRLAEVEPLLALLAEARKSIARTLSLLSGPGYILREAQAIEGLGAGPIPELRATLSRIDAALAAEPEARR